MAELYMSRTCKWGTLRVVGGDVWNHEGDVLITPANNRLSGREGIDYMVHQKAGEELTQATRNICLEMRKINAPPCAVTQNVVTEPYALADRFKHIIHVVGPDCRRPNQDETRRDLLPVTYENLFKTLDELDGVETIVTPPISMGVFAYPHREGARLTLETVLGILDAEEDPGIKMFTVVVKEKNFISNMRTVYREINDLLRVLTRQTNEDEAMSDLPRMVSVALESSKFAFDAVLMVSNDSRKVRSIVPVLPKNVPLRVMTSLNRVRDALIEHQIDAQVLEEGLSSKGLSVLNELYDLVLQGMGERWVAKGGRLLIVMAEPIDGVLVVDSAMLGAGRLASIAEEQAIELDVLMRMIELSRAVGTRGREGSAVGALFAIGNIQKMRGHSTSMVLNPFKGHSVSKRDVRNRENHETMAEFAWLDGAILFNREGIASDAGRYIQVPAGLSPKSGEGGRHLAARAISQLSDGVSIAVFFNWKYCSLCQWA